MPIHEFIVHILHLTTTIFSADKDFSFSCLVLHTEKIYNGTCTQHMATYECYVHFNFCPAQKSYWQLAFIYFFSHPFSLSQDTYLALLLICNPTPKIKEKQKNQTWPTTNKSFTILHVFNKILVGSISYTYSPDQEMCLHLVNEWVFSCIEIKLNRAITDTEEIVILASWSNCIYKIDFSLKMPSEFLLPITNKRFYLPPTLTSLVFLQDLCTLFCGDKTKRTSSLHTRPLGTQTFKYFFCF